MPCTIYISSVFHTINYIIKYIETCKYLLLILFYLLTNGDMKYQ